MLPLTKVIILLTVICFYLGFMLLKAHMKLQKYKLRNTLLNIRMARFQEIYRLHPEFGFLTRPFTDYVNNGNAKIEHVVNEIRTNYFIEKDKIIARRMSSVETKTPELKTVN